MTDFSIHDELFNTENGKYETKMRKFYKARMEKIARSMFKWTCSEDHITGDLIEKYLWMDGRCVIWKHDMLGWIVTRADPVAWNINGIEVAWRPIADRVVDGVELPDMLTEDECIPIYEWSSHHVQRKFATFLANEMADVNETIRMQVFNQKTPLLCITGNDKTKEKMKNLIMNVGDNMKVMFMNTDLMQGIETLDFNAPFNVPDLWAHKQSIYNDFLAWIGCDSQDAYQKKERKIVSEQEGNNEELNYVLADQLNERLKACDIASKFGLTLTVEVQRSVRPADSEMEGDPEQPDDNQTTLGDFDEAS